MRTGKTPQHKSTYTINTRLCNRGRNPVPASSHPDPQPLIHGAGHRPACQAGGSKRRRRGIGGGEVNAYLYICVYVCVCVIVCNQQVSVEWGRNARASHCSALPRVDFPAAALAEASAGTGEPKKVRLIVLSWGE